MSNHPSLVDPPAMATAMHPSPESGPSRKRRADDDNDGDDGHGDDEEALDRARPSPKRAAPRAAAAVAEGQSINDILRSHPRERLYVVPLQWTERHLELLGCAFVPQRRAINENLDDDDDDDNEHDHGDADASSQGSGRAEEVSGAADERKIGPLTLTAAAKQLSSADTRVLALWTILMAHDFHNICIDAYFVFDKHVSLLPTDGMFAASPARGAFVSVAVLDLDMLAERRNTSVAASASSSGTRRSDDDRPNVPAMRLQRKRQDMLRPHKMTQDPFIAALLIGLAQGQLHTMQNWREPSCFPLPPGHVRSRVPNFPVFVLATAAHRVYLYAANITLSFLYRMYNPSARVTPEVLPVHYDQIPLEELSDSVIRMGDSIYQSWAP